MFSMVKLFDIKKYSIMEFWFKNVLIYHQNADFISFKILK